MGGYVTPAVELEGTELPPPPANLPVRGEQEVTEPLQHHRNKYTQLANTGFQNVTMTCSKETNQGNIKKKKKPRKGNLPYELYTTHRAGVGAAAGATHTGLEWLHGCTTLYLRSIASPHCHIVTVLLAAWTTTQQSHPVQY